MRSVIVQQCKGDIRKAIKDTNGLPPTGQDYIRQFQKGVTAYINGLSKKERAEYEELAIKWNVKGPDPDERQK